MRDITATVLPGGPVTVEGIPGFAEEHNAAQLIVTLNDELSAADISCHYLCFDLYGLARKIFSNAIYDETDTPAYRQGNRLFCPLPQALTAGGELTVQVEAHRIVAGEVVSIVKSGLFTLEFEPSLMGNEEPFDTDCALRERLMAALAAFETMKSQVEVLTPAAYGALTSKRATTFYLVDSDAPPPEDDDDEGEIEDPPPGPIVVTGILLSPVTASVPLNTTLSLTATAVPGNAANKDVTWSSGNTTVATVSQNGTVTGRGAGVTNITVTTVDGGFTAFCAVTVAAAVPRLWQGTKTVNGVTITISGGHVTMNGRKTIADYGTGSMYFTDNVTDVSNIAACPAWAECKTGDTITFVVKNKTGTCTEVPANAACQIRNSANAVLCGATWGNPTGSYSYTFAADMAVLGIFCYLSPGAVATDYAFDVEVSLNGARWV